MYIYIYVCMYVCANVQHACTCVHIDINAYMHVLSCIYTHKPTHIHSYIHTSISIYTYTYTYGPCAHDCRISSNSDPECMSTLGCHQSESRFVHPCLMMFLFCMYVFMCLCTYTYGNLEIWVSFCSSLPDDVSFLYVCFYVSMYIHIWKLGDLSLVVFILAWWCFFSCMYAYLVCEMHTYTHIHASTYTYILSCAHKPTHKHGLWHT